MNSCLSTSVCEHKKSSFVTSGNALTEDQSKT